MGLADRLKAGVDKPAPKCKVRDIAATLEQDDADALLALVFERRDLNPVQVSKFLRPDGIFISDDVIRRHRKGECRACPEAG